MPQTRRYLPLALAAVVLLAIGAAVGRFGTPARVEIRTEERIRVERQYYTAVVYQSFAVTNQRTVTRTVVKEAPDGTKETTIDSATETKIQTKTESNTVTSGTETETKFVTKVEVREKQAGWRASALVGAQLRNPVANGGQGLFGPVVYGGLVERRVVGPMFVGLWGLSSGVAGASLSFEF